MKNKTKIAASLSTLMVVSVFPVVAYSIGFQEIQTIEAQTVYTENESTMLSAVSKDAAALIAQEADVDVDYTLAYQVEMTGSVEKLPEPAVIEVIRTSSVKTATAGKQYNITRFTRYGVDCSGCNVNAAGEGHTSSGVKISTAAVRQSNGTWQQGITYNGYYIIAMDSSVPLYTIVEISNHNLSGAGITPGVPFKAIVLDRGGSVDGLEVDLFIGSEKNIQVKGSAKGALLTIVGQ